MIELKNALSLSVEQLTDSFNHCFEDYVIPITLTPNILASMLRCFAFDLGSSILAVEDGAVVGCLMVCRRGDISRIGAMAVAKAVRNQGVGRKMLTKALDDARGRGDLRVVLEAIEHNHGAIRFYESLGFQIVGRLEGFECAPPEPDLTIELSEVGLGTLAAMILTRGDQEYSWETNHASVSQLANPVRALVSGEVGAAVSESAKDTLVIRSLTAPKEGGPAVKRFTSGLASRFPGRKILVQPSFRESVFGTLLREAGYKPSSLAQVQMELLL